MIKNFFRAFVGVLALVIGFSFSASAQQKLEKDFSNIEIKNFGQMDERFYRGGQPKKDQYQSLADLGIDTVIDLRNDPKDHAKSTVEALGMKYINIPMSDRKYPPAESIETFMKTVEDPATGTFFVHCAGGKHRTGVTGAVYRFTKYGWDFDQVYSEMKKYKFYTMWGHGKMKDFVEDYAKKIEAGQISETSK